MFNQGPKTQWIPYSIPPTPTKSNPSDQYALSFTGNGNPSENPSKYLQWRKITSAQIPTPPSSGFYVLTAQDGELIWSETTSCEEEV